MGRKIGDATLKSTLDGTEKVPSQTNKYFLVSAVADYIATLYGLTHGLISLFDHYTDVGNTGTGEDDLYSDTLAAGQLATNGDKIQAEYGGIFVGHATATREIKVKFAGTAIFDTTALAISSNASWHVRLLIIRVSTTVIRYAVSLDTQNAPLADYVSAGELTGLTLSGTNILKLTGEAAGVGAATNDIVAKLGTVLYVKAA